MGTMLFLRTCDADGISRNGFRWPKEVGSEVICPDWDPAPECGHGLHGLLNGSQNGGLLNWSPDALWLVVEAEESDCVDLNGKWKFSKCVVVESGSRKEATDFLVAAGCTGVHGATVTGGDGATVTGGYRATVTGGDGATVTGGYRATVTGGDGATVTGGDGATLLLSWWDSTNRRERIIIAYVGEVGILPNTKYRLNSDHEFEVAK